MDYSYSILNLKSKKVSEILIITISIISMIMIVHKVYTPIVYLTLFIEYMIIYKVNFRNKLGEIYSIIITNIFMLIFIRDICVGIFSLLLEKSMSDVIMSYNTYVLSFGVSRFIGLILILNFNKFVSLEIVKKLLVNRNILLMSTFTIISLIILLLNSNHTYFYSSDAISTTKIMLIDRFCIAFCFYFSVNEKIRAIKWFEEELDTYKKLNFFNELVDKSKDVMFFKDSNFIYTYLNNAGENFLNRDKDKIIGKTDLDLLNENFLDEKLYYEWKLGDKIALEQGYYDRIETKGNRIFRVSKEKIDGGILGIARDITDEMKAIEKSELDELTKIFNRRRFKIEINKIYLNKNNNTYLILIDLDDLRNLNNNYGHNKGDEYLSIIGEILKEENRCMFFRIGGDEFAGLIDISKTSPEIVLKSIFEKINSIDINPKISISVGCKRFFLDKTYIENYDEVDNLLYEAKEKGKNKFIIEYD
ncbi:diguanylate cyclase [Clostridium ihumii]